MSQVRAINVLTLSAILFLAGCFGFGDSAEADDDEITVSTEDLTEAMILASNSPPDLSVKKFDHTYEFLANSGVTKSNWDYSGYFFCLNETDYNEMDIGDTLEEQRQSLEEDVGEDGMAHLANLVTVGDCLLYFDFLSVDPDGDTVTKGLDVDFDGNIDVPIEPNYGFTIAAVDDSAMRSVWNGMGVYELSCKQIDIAFIAVDEHGASTSEFMHFIGMGSCEETDYEDDDDDDNGGGLDLYYFSARDAAGDMDDGGRDNLVHVMMNAGSGLSWSVLKVTIVVDNGPSYTCEDINTDDGSAYCTYTIDSTDSEWNVAEEIRIEEGSVDLCDGTGGGCDVDVTITKLGVGGENDRVLAMVNAFADAAS